MSKNRAIYFFRNSHILSYWGKFPWRTGSDWAILNPLQVMWLYLIDCRKSHYALKLISSFLTHDKFVLEVYFSMVTPNSLLSLMSANSRDRKGKSLSSLHETSKILFAIIPSQCCFGGYFRNVMKSSTGFLVFPIMLFPSCRFVVSNPAFGKDCLSKLLCGLRRRLHLHNHTLSFWYLPKWVRYQTPRERENDR